MLVSLAEAKNYLRIDGNDENSTIKTLLKSAESLCMDIARMEETEFEACGEIAKTAVLYTLAYFYEHREEADHHVLTLTLRSLLLGIRKEGF